MYFCGSHCMPWRYIRYCIIWSTEWVSLVMLITNNLWMMPQNFLNNLAHADVQTQTVVLLKPLKIFIQKRKGKKNRALLLGYDSASVHSSLYSLLLCVDILGREDVTESQAKLEHFDSFLKLFLDFKPLFHCKCRCQCSIAWHKFRWTHD